MPDHLATPVLPGHVGIAPPADLVQVGYVSGAYGLQGWVRITPHSTSADALMAARVWWLDKPSMRDVDVMQVKMHSGDVVARLTGIVGRDAADALKGASVQIPRSRFPALADGEFYWIDLIGLAVVNTQGEQLGVVHDMMDNGAHPILRIAPPVAISDDAGTEVSTSRHAGAAAAQLARSEILIPFVEQFVITVDRPGKLITVDWGLDY